MCCSWDSIADVCIQLILLCSGVWLIRFNLEERSFGFSSAQAKIFDQYTVYGQLQQCDAGNQACPLYTSNCCIQFTFEFHDSTFYGVKLHLVLKAPMFWWSSSLVDGFLAVYTAFEFIGKTETVNLRQNFWKIIGNYYEEQGPYCWALRNTICH